VSPDGDGRTIVTVPGQDPATPGGETPPQPPAAPAAPAPDRGSDGEAFDAERARRTIEAQRATERELKAKLKELEPLAAKARELEDAQKSELERAQAKAEAAERKAADAEAKARQALVRSAVMVELGKQGAANPARIYALVDQAGLEIDDDGTVTGADKAVEKLLKDEPYLVAQQQSTNGTATRTVPGTPKPSGAATKEQEVDQVYRQMTAGGVARW
jgi:membrane-associated HD superfamily phosphohydrolase